VQAQANDVKDWGWSFNLGYLFKLDSNTSFGLRFRSSILHMLRGSTVWDFSTVSSDPVVNRVLAAASRRANSAAPIAVRTPEPVSVNAYRQFNAKWAVMADLTWTRHNRLADLNIEPPRTSEGAEVIRQQWRNTLRASVGANYACSDVQLEAGRPVLAGPDSQLPGPQESIGQLHQQLHTADDQLYRQWRNHERKFQTHVSFLGVADNYKF
jgi:long-chain fatty acid transport protein